MILSKEARSRLKKLGLDLYEKDNFAHVIKKLGRKGNFIPEWRNEKAAVTDCPHLELQFQKKQFIIRQWDWEPGPAHGGFLLEFKTETKAIDFIEKYYFSTNEYFEARKTYERNSRNSYNLDELKKIFDAVLSQSAKVFGNGDIPFRKGPYHKLPIDNWNFEKFESERPTIKVNMGILSSEMFYLREKISKNKQLNFEDVNNISSLLFDLSINLSKKKSRKVNKANS